MDTIKSQSVADTSIWALARKWISAEAAITWRLIRDNLTISITTVPLVSLSAGIGAGLNSTEISESVGKAIGIALLIVYIFDCCNQAKSSAEDARNKPYRPIPAGLATPQGIQLRGWIATALYILTVWLFGLSPWVLLWPFITMVQFRLPERGYIWWKSPTNVVHLVVMPFIGWSLSTDLDSAAWNWLLAIVIYFTFAFPIEDVRDLEGDRAIGRLTPVMLLGRAFVCRYFAVFMIFLPFFIYLMMAFTSGENDWKYLLPAVILGSLSWICAARALFLQGYNADRLTYQLYCVVWALTCVSGPLFLA